MHSVSRRSENKKGYKEGERRVELERNGCSIIIRGCGGAAHSGTLPNAKSYSGSSTGDKGRVFQSGLVRT